MTISFTKSDSFEKQKFSASEASDAESKPEDFAALFSVSVIAPPINAPVKVAEPENSSEIEIDAQLIESNQNLFEKDSQTQLFFSQKADVQKSDFVPPNREILTDTKFTESDLTTENQLQTNFAAETLNRRAIVKKDFGLQVFATQRGITNVELMTSLRRELVPPLSIKSFLAQTETVNAEINHLPMEYNQEKHSNTMPNLFGEISNIVKTDTSNPENAGEIKVHVQPLESNQNLSEKNSPIKPGFLQTTKDLQMQKLSQPNFETFSDTKFADSTVENLPKPNFTEEISNRSSILKKDFGLQIFASLRSITNVELTTSLRRELVPPLSGQKFPAQIQVVNAEIIQFSSGINQEKLSNNVQKLFDEISNVVKADNFKPENKEEIKVDAPSVESSQDVSETDSPIKPLPAPASIKQNPDFIAPNYEALPDTDFAESSLTTENQPKTSVTDETFKRNILKKDAGFQLFTTHQNVTNNQSVSILNYQPTPILNGHTVFTQTQAVKVEVNQFSPVVKTDNSNQADSTLDFMTGEKITEQIKPDISGAIKQNIPVQIQTEPIEVNQLLLKIIPEQVSSDVPKLSNDVSNVVKADNSIKTNSTPDLMTEQKIVEQIKQNISGESGQNLNQSERESPKNGKEFKVRENSAGQIFDNFLNPVSKEQKIVETVPQANNLNGKVFEQIEPRILELAAFNRTGGEKQILKMRLNPDELGAVEITLEKSSTGKINAHFQTETEPARQVLMENLNQLRDSLQNSGWQVGDLEISCNSSSSNGNERRENQSQQFGTTENQPVETTNSDGNSKGEDDKQSRLVNLRA